MSQPLPDSELVVATPERVSFDYQVAGLATRGIAQAVDLLILAFVLAGVYVAAIAVGAFGLNAVAWLIAILGTLVVVFGYHWTCEAFWSGQTVGKKVFRLRAVGDRGEPMTFGQAGIRNIVRLVDFLPYAYGIGLVVLFVNGRGKRLGDLAAGTIVVKDSDYLPLAGPRRAPHGSRSTIAGRAGSRHVRAGDAGGAVSTAARPRAAALRRRLRPTAAGAFAAPTRAACGPGAGVAARGGA